MSRVNHGILWTLTNNAILEIPRMALFFPFKCIAFLFYIQGFSKGYRSFSLILYLQYYIITSG